MRNRQALARLLSSAATAGRAGAAEGKVRLFGCRRCHWLAGGAGQPLPQQQKNDSPILPQFPTLPLPPHNQAASGPLTRRYASGAPYSYSPPGRNHLFVPGAF
jgi:hypothetical protein